MSSKAFSLRRNIDLLTFCLYLSLIGVGWMMIYAVGYDEQSASAFSFNSAVGKQTVWIIISLAIMGGIFLIDSKFWVTFAYPLYGISLLLLIGVVIFGLKINGARSWYSLGGFTLQPSELAKFGTCLAIAAYTGAANTKLKETQSWLIAFAIISLPILLILLQPDPGSALVFTSFLLLFFRLGLSTSLYVFVISAALFFILGLVFDPVLIILGLIGLICLFMIFNVNQKYRMYLLGGFVLIVSFVIYAITQLWLVPIGLVTLITLFGLSYMQWQNRKGSLVRQLFALLVLGSLLSVSANYTFNNILKRHHQDRINVWLKPSASDPQGALYNLLQSKIAIGSGGLHGKGFLEGTHTKLNYVPEQTTDFIFCTIGEEQGFIGSFGVIGLYLLLVWRIITIAERQRSDFNRNYAYGVAGILFIHFFVNIGMTMGLVPIVGIPLPLISKGGSSLMGFTLLIGVLLKLDRSRIR